jgi:hypothetical protein
MLGSRVFDVKYLMESSRLLNIHNSILVLNLIEKEKNII